MKTRYVILLLVAVSIIGPGVGYVSGRLSVVHDPNADPYKYCFKIDFTNHTLPPPYNELVPFVPPGKYAICRIGD